MPTRFRGIAAAVAALMLVVAARADIVHMHDGNAINGDIVALSGPELSVRADGKVRKLATGSITAVELTDRQDGAESKSHGTAQPDAMRTARQAVIVLNDGSVLAVSKETIRQGVIRGNHAVLDKLAIDIEKAARLLRPGAGQTPASIDQQRLRLKVTRGEKDVLLVRGGGDRMTRLEALVDSLDDKSLSLDYEGTATAIKADTVALIEFAKLGPTKSETTAARCTLRDGSVIAATQIAIAGKNVKVASASLGSLTFERGDVTAIRFAGEATGRTRLSELKPTRVSRVNYFGGAAKQSDNDASSIVSRKALRLGDRTYEHGIQMNARTVVTYALNKRFKRLTFIAGIDGNLRHGAAVLSVAADGKQALKPVVLQRDAEPRTVSIDVQGVEALTITVDFADGTYGSGGRANLCDAWLIE